MVGGGWSEIIEFRRVGGGGGDTLEFGLVILYFKLGEESLVLLSKSGTKNKIILKYVNDL